MSAIVFTGPSLAPDEARERLHAAGASVAMTTHRLKKRGDFLKHVRRAVREGLREILAFAPPPEVQAEVRGRIEGAVVLRPLFLPARSVVEADVDADLRQLLGRDDAT